MLPTTPGSGAPPSGYDGDGNIMGTAFGGAIITVAGGGKVFLPSIGNRNDTSPVATESGLYWSSISYYDGLPRTYSFYFNDQNQISASDRSATRDRGYSIRCVKDQ